MPHMLKELSEDPESGLLGYEMSTFGGLIVQYWRSFEHLERFANGPDDPHVAAWRNYWKRVGKDTRTGIWHETYLVRAGEYEAIYGNMPPFGLGKASALVPRRTPAPPASGSSAASPSRTRVNALADCPGSTATVQARVSGGVARRRGRRGPG